MNSKTVFTLLTAVFFASIFAWTDSASGQQSRTEKRAERAEEKAEKLAERAERKQRGEQGAETQARNSGDGGPQEVALKLKGDQGTSLSGSCVVGDEETTIDGEVPQSFEYTLNGQEKLECEIEKEGEGALKVMLTGDGVDAVQRIGPQPATVNLTYGGGGGVSFSSSSSGSTGSASSSSVSSSTSTDLG